MQSWQAGQSVVVTEVLAAPQTNILNVFLVCGNLDEVMSIQPKLQRFAKEMNCSKLVMRGRAGWTKVLPEYGWKSPGVIFELPVNKPSQERNSTMADDPKDDKYQGGAPQGAPKSPDAKRQGEEPGPKNDSFGGGQQPKADKSDNIKSGDPEQDTHK